ncbi:MAG: fibrillarin-like rRNA/tRNA 2'-O-methyltransferase [archaeon]
MQEIFEGIYKDGNVIYTKNMQIGKRFYKEKIKTIRNEEYREWDSHRSKYAAAIANGLSKSIFHYGENVLYLGSAEGQTLSHVSDIVSETGLVFGVDISEIAMMKLVALAETRTNILPLLNDAENAQTYAKTIEETCGKVDALFMDISQRNQAEIFVKNCQFLKQHHLGALVVKIKSISQSKKKEDVLEEEKKTLQKEGLEIIQVVDLAPYEKHHYLILVKKK